MKRLIFSCSIATIVAFIAGFLVGRPNNPQNKDLVKAYNNYVVNAEVLITYIIENDEDFFDTVAETDAYVDYIEACENLSDMFSYYY